MIISADQTWMRVTAHQLNLRNAAGLSSRVIGTLAINERVAVLDPGPLGYWIHVKTASGKSGWASSKYLVSDGTLPQVVLEPAWMAIARRELAMGVAEIPGARENPRVLEYLRSTTLGRPYNEHDETPWCAAFVNFCVEQARYAGMDSARALDWLKWGVRIAKPVLGCVVVFVRDGGGHVAFYIGDAGDSVEVLGGNQSNAVRISKYPKSRIRGYRLPADLAVAA